MIKSNVLPSSAGGKAPCEIIQIQFRAGHLGAGGVQHILGKIHSGYRMAGRVQACCQHACPEAQVQHIGAGTAVHTGLDKRQHRIVACEGIFPRIVGMADAGVITGGPFVETLAVEHKKPSFCLIEKMKAARHKKGRRRKAMRQGRRQPRRLPAQQKKRAREEAWRMKVRADRRSYRPLHRSGCTSSRQNRRFLSAVR